MRQPLFHAIKWAGVAYLSPLALQAFRSAATGRYRAAVLGCGRKLATDEVR